MFNSAQEFQDNYIQSFTTWIYTRQIPLFIRKIRNSKTKIVKDDYTYLLFTTYLQLFENFQIFLLVLFDSHWIENIFNSTKTTIERFNYLFEQSEDPIQKRKNTYNFKSILNQIIGVFVWEHFPEYHRFITSALEDYKNHKQLLNSFKHGFRINSQWKQTLAIWRGNIMHPIIECDSTLVYYIKEKNRIYEISHSFNMEYIAVKAEFLINIINNLKIIYLKKWKTSAIFTTNDTPVKIDTSGFKTPIFEIKVI